LHLLIAGAETGRLPADFSVTMAAMPRASDTGRGFPDTAAARGFGMTDDKRVIRDLIAAWMAASQAGDVAKILSLMTDDAVFMVPGREPFGKEAFAAASQAMKDVRMEGESDIRELEVLGDWAYLRAYIKVTMTPPGGTPVRRAGYTLTILRKQPDGRWLLARDANLMTLAP
jgi:uncharacterized protein (TIGR02246 family)